MPVLFDEFAKDFDFATVERLVKDMDAQSRRSHDAHERLWEHQDEQDKTLTNHEIRITKLENHKEES